MQCVFSFHSRNSQSRENINYPEDESVGGVEGDVIGGEHSPGKKPTLKILSVLHI